MESLLATRPSHAGVRPNDDHPGALRLWMRLAACTTTIEHAIRRRLRDRYATSPARFDLMAELGRAPTGLRMGEVARRLRVSAGSVTEVVAQLATDGWVERTVDARDRRAGVVRLSALGHEAFRRMAAEHERWIVALVDGMSGADRARLHALLAALETLVIGHEAREADEGEFRATAQAERGGLEVAIGSMQGQ